MYKNIVIILNYITMKNIKFVTILLSWKTNDLLRLQQSFNLVGTRWTIFNQNSSQFQYFANNHVTISNFDYTQNIQIFNNSANTHLLTNTNKWLIFSKNFSIFHSIKLRMDSDVTLVNPEGNLYDLYNPGFGFGGELTIIQHPLALTKYSYRKNLSGIDLRVATIMSGNRGNLSVEEYFMDFEKKFSDNIQKLNFGLFKLLQNIHNFSYKLKLSGVATGSTRTGIDQEISGWLQEDLLDISATPTYLNSEIVESFDLITPTYKYRSGFVFRNPGNFEGRNEFLQPMSTNVWFATLILTILVILLLRFVYTFNVSLNENLEEINRINCEEGKEWSAVISDTLSILIQQGTNYEPTLIAGKIILFSYLALAVLLYNYYTSTIVSDLLSLPPPPFKNIQELTRTNLQFGIIDSPFLQTMFQDSDEDILTKVYCEKMNFCGTSPNSFEVQVGVDKMKNSPLIFYGHTDAIYDLVQKTFDLKLICDINQINVFKPKSMYIYSQKHSQYTKLFTISYMKMMEMGSLNYVSSKWLTKQPPCLANRDIIQVGLQKCRPVYNMFIIGCVTSLLILGIENLMEKCLANSSKIKKKNSK